MSKILNCASDDDTVLIKAEDDADKVFITFEAKNLTEDAEYDFQLMDLDSERFVSVNLFECSILMIFIADYSRHWIRSSDYDARSKVRKDLP